MYLTIQCACRMVYEPVFFHTFAKEAQQGNNIRMFPTVSIN